MAEFNARVKKLEDDFAFLAKSNIGYDVLSDEEVKRVHEIAKQTYYRYFDKTLGLSWDETERIKDNMPPKTNPHEPLLEDRPDHIFGGYNRGEIHNLSIARGTLTPEEAKKLTVILI